MTRRAEVAATALYIASAICTLVCFGVLLLTRGESSALFARVAVFLAVAGLALGLLAESSKNQP